MYVVGNAASNLYGRHQGGGLDAFVARYDASGHLLWGRQFGTSAFDSATAVGTDAWDNVYVVGTTTGNLAGSRGGYDAFLRKYTPNGEVVWTRQLGGSGSDSIQDLAVDAGGNVYLQQSLNSQLGVAKYSPDGVRLWTRHAGASTCNGSLAVSENGDVYTASFVGDGTGTTLCLNRMTANGGILWVQYVRYEARFYGGASFSGARVAASGNHVYVTGANGPAGNNDSNIFVAHFDALSPQQPTWQYTNLGFWGWDSVNDVAADANGVYIAGLQPLRQQLQRLRHQTRPGRELAVVQDGLRSRHHQLHRHLRFRGRRPPHRVRQRGVHRRVQLRGPRRRAQGRRRPLPAPPRRHHRQHRLDQMT